jgi:hypothetical protein
MSGASVGGGAESRGDPGAQRAHRLSVIRVGKYVESSY